MKEHPSDRRRWPRIPVPDDLFELLRRLAVDEGLNERTMYVLIYRLVKEARPNDTEFYSERLKTDWIDPPQK